jgi:hypothetical protein
VILTIIAVACTLAYTLACLQALRLSRFPRPTRNLRGTRLVRFLILSKQLQ